MESWSVAVDNGSFESAGITRDGQNAVCELILNGFEAMATEVNVELSGGSLIDAPAITIRDNGTGIAYETLRETFGTFLSPGKRNGDGTIRLKSQPHRGKGRFAYLSLARSAQWRTVYERDQEKVGYTITLEAENKAAVSATEPVPVDPAQRCGTTVTMSVEDPKTLDSLSFRRMEKKLVEEFAWYICLMQDRGGRLTYGGQTIDPGQYRDDELSRKEKMIFDDYVFNIHLAVWKNRIGQSGRIYYLNGNGEIVHAKSTQRNRLGFYHTVYVRSNFFTQFPDLLTEEHPSADNAPELKETLKKLTRTIDDLLSETQRRFMLGKADAYFRELERKGLYPDFSGDALGAARKADFTRIAKAIYQVEPGVFYPLKPQQTQSMLGFLALLLRSGQRESILGVVEQMTELTKEQRRQLADRLRRGKLERLMDRIALLQSRCEAVCALKELVRDDASFAEARERIQQLVDSQEGLLGDQYGMAAMAPALREALEAYEGMVAGEADLFLYAARMTAQRDQEGLIVNLKAPSAQLTPVLFARLEAYANAIRRDPGCSVEQRRWKIYAVCAALDDDVKARLEGYQPYGKQGLAGVLGHVEIYALTWEEIFLGLASRHRFLAEAVKKECQGMAALAENAEDQAALDLAVVEAQRLIDSCLS